MPDPAFSSEESEDEQEKNKKVMRVNPLAKGSKKPAATSSPAVRHSLTRAHLNIDEVESNLGVPGNQGRHENVPTSRASK